MEATKITDCLREQPLFAGLEEEKLQWVSEQGEVVEIEAEDRIAAQGDPPDGFYVILEGQTEWTRNVGGEEVYVVTLGPGDIFAELIMVLDEPYPTTGHATTDVSLYKLDVDAFWNMLRICPEVLKSIVSTSAERAQLHETVSQQQAKLASLGTLAAGLAHELNNPAAASVRAAGRLRECFESMRSIGMEVSRLASSGSLSPEEVAGIERISTSALTKAAAAEDQNSLEHSEREENLARWMEDRGVEQAWDFAATFAEAGLDVSFLEGVSGVVGSECIGEALRYQEAVLAVAGLVEEVEASTTRVSSLVETMKAYSHMDQTPLQEVDVNEELENTLAILAYRLDDVEVERDYGDLPSVTAYGGELNQVWTSLLENAADAVAGEDAGRIRMRTACENDRVLVRIEDDGPGIPKELQTRIFEPFFTTKGVGEGTGLGLDVSYRIVVGRHNGDIRVVSGPGDGTCMEVRLPVSGPDGEPVEQPRSAERVSG